MKSGRLYVPQMTTIEMALLFQEGETPLIKATKMRNIEIVELLLDKGAKVSAMDKVLQTKHIHVKQCICKESLM